MNHANRTMTVLAGSAVALVALMPLTASAHTNVFLGIRVGGWPVPPVAVYAPPVYYAPPPPPPVYYAPAYYAPRVIYETPRPVYYYYRGDREWGHRWHADRDRGWHGDDHGWHRGRGHRGDDGDDD